MKRPWSACTARLPGLACTAIRRRVPTEMCEFFGGDVDPLPLHDLDVFAGAVRVAVHRPDAARGLDPVRDLDGHRALTAIAIAAHQRAELGDPGLDPEAVLGAVVGIDAREARECWDWFQLGDAWRADPHTVVQCRQLAWWRRQRDACVRAAIACERMDLSAAYQALDSVHAHLTRARSKVGAAA